MSAQLKKKGKKPQPHPFYFLFQRKATVLTQNWRENRRWFWCNRVGFTWRGGGGRELCISAHACVVFQGRSCMNIAPPSPPCWIEGVSLRFKLVGSLYLQRGEDEAGRGWDSVCPSGLNLHPNGRGDVSNLPDQIPFLVLQLLPVPGHQGWAKDGQDQIFHGKEGRNRLTQRFCPQLTAHTSCQVLGKRLWHWHVPSGPRMSCIQGKTEGWEARSSLLTN